VVKGKPAFTYNYLGLGFTTIMATKPMAAGKHTVVYDFAYEGPGMGKGGVGTISVDGVKVGEGRLEKTQPGIFSVDDLADVGIDLGTPVGDYAVPNHFKGTIHKVTISLKQ
jgi:arylsulfatase